MVQAKHAVNYFSMLLLNGLLDAMKIVSLESYRVCAATFQVDKPIHLERAVRTDDEIWVRMQSMSSGFYMSAL